MRSVDPAYEYAGFLYEMKWDGERFWAFPLSGQHMAASKDKHLRAAVECFTEDQVRAKNMRKQIDKLYEKIKQLERDFRIEFGYDYLPRL